MARFALDQRAIRRLAVLADPSVPHSSRNADAFVAELKVHGRAPVWIGTYTSSDAEFKRQLAAIKRAKDLAMQFGCEEIMFIFKYGGMPMKMAEKSMKLFAKEVMPALQELNPQPLEVQDAA